MSHQDVSVMRALSTKITLTERQAVQSAGRCAEKKQTRTNWCGTLPQPELLEFRSDHLFLHSTTFCVVLTVA